ncbi:MAG: FAD-linked oxidase [Chloroflexi bacterium]|nr:MAG: FAD-linked oxidase [Chloroflexota bacterium]
MDTALADFMDELQKYVDGDLRTDEYSRVLYSTDASIYQVMPYGVLIPRSTADVQAAVACAAKYQIPLVARTGGSSLAGQTVNEALIIDFSRHLNQVLAVNQEERWVRLQPGLVLDELNLQLQPYGLQFGPDPASSNRAAMGGIVSNNSTGAHSILYGMTADHVLETKVILNDGTTAHFEPLGAEQLAQKLNLAGREGAIYQQINDLVTLSDNQDIVRTHTPRHWRRCGGYNLDRLIPPAGLSFQWPVDARFNLARLICGAEGTLGVMTEIKLNLVQKPTQTALAIVHFEALHTALTAVSAILETEPSAVELLDNLGLTMCREVPEYARLLDSFIDGQPNCVLITEFYGESQAALQAKVSRLQNHLAKQGVGETAVVSAYDPTLQSNVWKVRKVGLGLLMSIKGDHKPIPFIEDAAIPPEHLAEYVEKVENFCHELGTDVAYYAHASAGCLHIRPLINSKKATEVAKLPEIAQFSVELLRGYGGAFSSEHGDGRARSWLNERFFGPELYGLYHQVKDIFDPQRIFNPGNIVEAGAMTENLRYGDTYELIPLTPHISFSEHEVGEAGPTPSGGFNRALEMCNGAGICRKRTIDTMCPSFMVTQEEMHATRGRVNLLRAALSGLLPPEEFTSQQMYAAMDLCIACKACKAECPSAVDMAKIKFEWLAQYYDVHGVPLRSKLFTDFGRLSKLGSGPLAPLANWGANLSLVRRSLEKAIGVSQNRQLPPLARQSFMTWFNKRQPSHINHQSAKKRVVLFVDPFTNYNYPHVGKAAVKLLAAVGMAPIAVPIDDDGRPAISKGLVAKAKAAARDIVMKLAPFAEQGLPIVGLEPSSILSLRDEFLYLLPADSPIKVVAQHTYTFEEFIDKLADEGNLNLLFTEEPRSLLLHGHCHQKALVGTEPSKRILALPPNYTVTEVDSGCCGMAGTFGYEAEHYDISRQMAERRLLPAVREAAPETIIVAAGLSCRQQIGHGDTGRTALHPAEVLANALVDLS